MKTTIVGTRFGTVEFDGDEVIQIDGGLVGLPELSRFVIFEAKPGSPFSWLQSLDDPSMAFLVTDPGRYVPEYEGYVAGYFPSFTDAVVLATATVPPGKPRDMTLNLCGPIVVDATTRHGKQIVLQEDAYTTRYRVFPPEESKQLVAA